MKKLDRINKLIRADKDIMKRIKAERFGTEEENINTFIRQAERYIKAIKEGRVINCIDKVSSSGMSRTIKFLECAKMEKGRYQYLNFYQFFNQLGYEKVRDSDYFRVHGCGMDMIFHTNYSNMYKLYHLGFIDKVKREQLAQMTPSTI